ncbi:MAG: M20/M25/M40 family metallo-hydrolase [Balneola sp.]
MSAMRYLFLIFLFITVDATAQLSAVESKLVDRVDYNNEEGLELLKKTIAINSGTMNFEGVKQVGDVLRKEFDDLGFETIWEDGSKFNRSGHLIAKHFGSEDAPKILLIGHLDTVFEKDSPFQEMEMVDENTMKAPGIADMKGGNVIMLQALRALKENNHLKDMNIWVVFTGDEEYSGSPLTLSKKALIDAAKWADIAIGFENGDGNPGTANISRRGSIKWELKTEGNPAHSSQIFQEKVGAGAIFEASRILNSFYEELRSEEFLTFNPGMMIGGTTLEHDAVNKSGTAFGKDNVVSKEVIISGDLRGLSPEQVDRVKAKMQEITSKHRPQTKATLTFYPGYPPMAPTDGNRELLSIYSKVSQDLGQGEVVAVNPLNAGAADVSFTADFVDMAIDAVGMSGADDHTVNETGYIPALLSQTQRAALLLNRLQDWKK